MTVHSRKRTPRKAAIAAAILGATLILPGSAVASHNPNNIIDHHTCDPASSTGCPTFEANFKVRVQNPTKNAASAVQFQFSQPDRHMPVMKADYYIPTGWRFGGLSNLDPAVQADGVTPATSCSQVHTGTGQVSRAEILSADTGMLVQINSRRTDNPDDLSEAEESLVNRPVFGPTPNGAAIEYGVRNPGGASEGNRWPSVSFLNWDGTTANLCYHHRNNTTAAPAQTFLQSATLTRLAGNPDYDWRLSIDVSSVYRNADVKDEQGSIIEHHLALGAITAGNWNKFMGSPQKVTFSRTPLDPGNYPFQADMFTCAEGLDDSHATGCRNGTYVAQTLLDEVAITPAPDTIRFQAGQVTGPATDGLCFNDYCPLGLIRGESSFEVSWNQPNLVEGQKVKGYALTVARPGNQASRKFFRIITDPDAPGFNAGACGPAGGDPICTFELNFPMQSTDGSTTLTPDKKYHLALVTIYDDGRRTDGLCDEAVGVGTTCDPNQPKLNVQEPGISTWQVLMRTEDWPNAYVEILDDSSNSTFDPVTNRLLLVDYALKEAELVIWNTNGDVTSIRNSSNAIVPLPTGGGLIEFHSGTSAGSTTNYVVSVVADPFGGAQGGYVHWNVKNPDLNPPDVAGWAEVNNNNFGCWFFDPFGLEIFVPYSGDCVVFLGGAL
ncbi:MAG: hypothetical protein R3246_05095 [Acidimicrobiia bacterium]|nr:hypothetical protein [Acidimicrobiia bacterium]